MRIKIPSFLKPSRKQRQFQYDGMYAAWPYPQPIGDIKKFHADGNVLYCDPSKDYNLFWPERPYKPDISILIAGCGTQEAALTAYNNPHSTVLGIDQSAASLAYAEELKKKHKLDNLELRQMDLRDAATLNRTFDLVMSTGVLHHLPEPEIGLRALEKVLAPNGVMALSLYAKYARTGVYMLQEAFRRMNTGYGKDAVTFARNLIATLPPIHPLQHYVSEHDMSEAHDTDVVDMFLNTQDRAYSVPEILAFAESGNLVFQGWFDNLYYYPDGIAPLGGELYERLSGLPEKEQWATVELLAPLRGHHRFMLRKKECALQSCLPTFSDEVALRFVPSYRRHLQVEYKGDDLIHLSREWHECLLSGLEAKLFSLVDGESTVGNIFTKAKRLHQPHIGNALKFFERMWHQGHLTFSTKN